MSAPSADGPAWRAAAALLIAAVAIAAAMPPQLAPWAGSVRALFAASWLALPAVVALVLALASRLLPPGPDTRRAGVDHTAIAVGLLLVLEPVAHLAVMAVCAWTPSALASEAVLPAAWQPLAAPGLAMRLVVLVLLVPACEELFFRGRLLPWLRQRLGPVSAVSLSALAFAAAHGDATQLAMCLPLGVLLGLMRLRGASLGACVFAHAVHNALFLLGGPGLIAAPWIAPALAGSGTLLVAMAWAYHLRPHPRPHLRFALALVAGCGITVALSPWHGLLMDRLYARAAHRLIVRWRIGDEHLLPRLDSQSRNGRLVGARRDLLVARLLAEPCQTPTRQLAVLTLLDPIAARAVEASDEDAYAEIADLCVAPGPYPALASIGRRLARQYPEPFAQAAVEYPEVLTRWFALPEEADAALAQIEVTRRFQPRRVLLRCFETRFPGLVADLLLRLPPEAVTPCDRRHLRLHYADADRRLAEVAALDPALAAAFGYEPADGPDE